LFASGIIDDLITTTKVFAFNSPFFCIEIVIIGIKFQNEIWVVGDVVKIKI